MCKKICLILALFVLSLPATAQQSVRKWSLGPLTWNDFKTVDHSNGEEHSYLEFSLSVDDSPREEHGVNTWTPTAEALLNRELSWVDSHHRTPNELHYNQVLFNIVELQRRHMQMEIDTLGQANIDNHMQQLISITDSFCLATRNGADTAAVYIWDFHIRNLMTEAAARIVQIEAEKRQQPLTENTTLRFGFSIGGAAQVLGNDLHNHFTNGGGMHIDFEFGQKQHLFSVGLYCGFAACKEDLLHKKDPNQDLYYNDPLSSLDLNLNYGYILLDLNRFRLTPFVGVGTQGFYYTPEVNNSSSLGFSTFSWRVGMDIRYHIRNNRYLDGNSFQQNYFSVYTRAYYSRATFWNAITTPNGGILNITFGLSFSFRNGYRKPRI